MKAKFAAVVLALASQAAFAGSITNGDFATNTTAGWSAVGPVAASANTATLTAGLGASTYTTLSQLLHLDAGDVLTGKAQFFSDDYMPYNDNAYVILGGVTLFASDVATVGNFGTGPLTSFSYMVTLTGDYLLQAGVANLFDNANSSQLQVSAFAVNAGAVPEPATFALLGLGMLGMAATRRRSAAGKQA
jgi:hypothetical protein